MTEPIKYRKKPVEIEAVHYVHSKVQDAAPILRWIRDGGSVADFDPSDATILIETLEGSMTAQSGDYIIRGVAGEFYTCKPDIFARAYEQVAND